MVETRSDQKSQSEFGEVGKEMLHLCRMSLTKSALL